MPTLLILSSLSLVSLHVETLRYCTYVIHAFCHCDISSSEIWREFIGYDVDLNLNPIIPSPDVLVSNGNNGYSDLVDGDLATCDKLNQTWCLVAMKVLSSACVFVFLP